MTNPLHPPESTDVGQDWPRTIQEAVAWLTLELSQAQKDEIAGMPEEDLISLHFWLGARIREDFGLWLGNDALSADCQKAKLDGNADAPGVGLPGIHPDDAAMVVIRALWGRLRH